MAQDIPAWGGDGVDGPGRGFGHDEVADPAEGKAQAAAGEPGGGVGPEVGEGLRTEKRAAEDVTIKGRILPPADHVAIEFGDGDAVEGGSGGQGLLGFHFERLTLERCQLYTNDGEFADDVSQIIVGRAVAVAEVVENSVESGAIGLGDDVIAFVPFDRAIFLEDMAGFEAHQDHELFQFGFVIDIAARVHEISGRCRTDNAIKIDSLPSPIRTVISERIRCLYRFVSRIRWISKLANLPIPEKSQRQDRQDRSGLADSQRRNRWVANDAMILKCAKDSV